MDWPVTMSRYSLPPLVRTPSKLKLTAGRRATDLDPVNLKVGLFVC